MPARRDKTLHYRRAEWLQPGLTLESGLRQAVQALPTVDDRTIEHGEDHFVRCLRSRRRQAGGIFLHITADTPGEPASTVPKQLNHSDLDVGEAPPPDDAEFMDGDAFLFVRDDHVCFCATGMRDGGIHYFLARLLEKAELGEDAGMFALGKVADADKLVLIEENGVKEIVLNASVNEAVAHYAARRSEPVGVLRAVGQKLYSLLADDQEDRQDNLMVQVTIAADGRVRYNAEQGYERLEELARRIVEDAQDGDSFTILTKDGQKITPEKIILQKTISIVSSGKTVSRDAAWNELLDYFRELSANHLIE
jgi:hypothetical protein